MEGLKDPRTPTEGMREEWVWVEAWLVDHGVFVDPWVAVHSAECTGLQNRHFRCFQSSVRIIEVYFSRLGWPGN